MMRTRRHLFPISRGEFLLNAIGTCLALYAIGSIMGVRWFG